MGRYEAILGLWTAVECEKAIRETKLIPRRRLLDLGLAEALFGHLVLLALPRWFSWCPIGVRNALSGFLGTSRRCKTLPDAVRRCQALRRI